MDFGDWHTDFADHALQASTPSIGKIRVPVTEIRPKEICRK
jgi:hypothetical protein